MKKFSFLAAAAVICALPTIAQAAPTSLPVAGVVSGYCSIGLGNVSSGTLSLAEKGQQRIATMKLSCNGLNTFLHSSSANGDFNGPTDPNIGAGYQFINYDWSLVVGGVNAGLGWVPEDQTPSSATKITSVAGHNLPMANGVDAEFFLKICYNPNSMTTGCAASDSQAITAPQGSYTESFSFELKPV